MTVHSRTNVRTAGSARRFLSGIALLAVLPGCSLFKGSFQVDRCLVPNRNSPGVKPTWSRQLSGARFTAPVLEEELAAQYGKCEQVPKDSSGEKVIRCDFPQEPSKELRAIVLEQVVKRCDEICENHKSGFVSQSVLDKLVFGVTGIGLSAAGSLASSGASNVLSAAATATQGTDKAVTKEVYADHIVPAISAAIAADQAKKLQLIREHEDKSTVAEYPIWAGLRDIQKYHDSCSFAAGLSLLQEDAAASKKKAEDDKNKSERDRMEGNFVKDQPGDLLFAFWKPGGKLDKPHDERLRKWLKDNKIDEPSLEFFIRSDSYREQRIKAAKELGLRVKEE